MTFDNLSAMDQVEHCSGWLFVVKALLDDRCVIAHPKYDLRCEPAQRKSNPVDPGRGNTLLIPGAIPFGGKDYLIFLRDVTRHYPSFGIAHTLLSGTERSAVTRDAAYRLICGMAKYIAGDQIGLTGSLATGNGLDNYSDIDLVLPQEQFDRLAATSFWQEDPDLKLRTEEEWVAFYHHYGVLSQLTAEEFARDARDKKQQFTYRGIPVSVFTVTGQDKILPLMDSCREAGAQKLARVQGEVLWDASGTLPGYSIIRSGDRARLVVNFHRTYQGSLKAGTDCTVQGYCCGPEGVLWVRYDDQCAVWVR